MEDTCPSKIIRITLYTHLLCNNYQNVAIIHECSKKLLEMNIASGFIETPSNKTRCFSRQAHGKLAESRRTRYELVLISWATQPDSQHNLNARTTFLETRIALGYTSRWRVSANNKECIASLLRLMSRVKTSSECKELQQVFEHVQKCWTCSRL